MKNVLITGIKSYIGNSIEKHLSYFPNDYSVKKISLRDGKWRKDDLSIFDVIIHVAGIAHVSSKQTLKKEYYVVNRDLTIELAKKAKKEGVKQFIFASSIIVYGDSSFSPNIININTQPNPKNDYGKSKLQAEEELIKLESDCFKVAILRLPMIYGKNSKGNYEKLAYIARNLPFFPDIKNKRSMLYIENLCYFIKLLIDNNDRGVFFPQNKEYVNTSEMVRLISEFNGKKIKLIKIFNPLIFFLGKFIRILPKVFGNLAYDKELSIYKDEYQLIDLKKSIEIIESRDH